MKGYWYTNVASKLLLIFTTKNNFGSNKCRANYLSFIPLFSSLLKNGGRKKGERISNHFFSPKIIPDLYPIWKLLCIFLNPEKYFMVIGIALFRCFANYLEKKVISDELIIINIVIMNGIYENFFFFISTAEEINNALLKKISDIYLFFFSLYFTALKFTAKLMRYLCFFLYIYKN